MQLSHTVTLPIVLATGFFLGASTADSETVGSAATIQPVVLVTGATGRQGGAVARMLLKSGYRVRALTRNSKQPAATALAAIGAEVVQGDFDQRASLDRAMRGAQAVFLVVASSGHDEIRQGKAVTDAARAAGVSHLIYSSSGTGEPGRGMQGSGKIQIENYIRNSGVPSGA